jgi:type II secretory pathway component PulF
MDSELALITLLPCGLAAAGALLWWSVSLAQRRDLDQRISPWVIAGRWLGGAMVLGGVLFLGTFMTHGLALVFWVATLVVFAAAVRRLNDARRQSLLWVIAVAAERGIPLPEAVRAFARESNDRMSERAVRLSDYLDAGVPLGLSLQRSGIAISPAAMLAADLGQHTGTLGPALRRVVGAGDVLEPTMRLLVQRVFYLFFLIAYLLVIVAFAVTKVIPQFERLHQDFNLELPARTTQLIKSVDFTVDQWWISIPLVITVCVVFGFSMAYFVGLNVREWPLVRRLWEPADQALILRWLASAVRQRRPVAEIVRLLAGYFPDALTRRRLESAAARIDRGGHWSLSLQQSGLIRHADSELFQASERAGNLSWALEEMADTRLRRFTYRCQTYMDVAFPAMLIALGAAVLFIALGILMPLFSLITSLT